MKEPNAAEGPEDQEVEDAVMDYLAEHPEAMDTVEGIADWWIPQMRVAVNKLARALINLTSKGVLEQIGSGREARYRLRREARRTQ